MPMLISVLGLGFAGADTFLSWEHAEAEKKEDLKKILLIGGAILLAGYVIAKAR